MTLVPGTRVGGFDIVSLLGAGGMGEVYRAHDRALNRDVAIKVLPDTFAADPERLARFSREAQTLAALNHPNIALIHGLELIGGTRAFVMELVEGDDLAQAIAAQRLAPDDVLPIARQIAEAVEAAHEQGIVHRDLKPANIKVRPDGTVKVLDFGLAKALMPAGLADVMQSPTITAHATHAGVILGTAAYMAPEQARGKVVDRRADIWAFGCVLYEMLTGTQAFAAEGVTDTLAAIIKSEPDLSKLPADTPPAIRTLLRRCLVKGSHKRLQSIGEARIAIEAVLEEPVSADSVTPTRQPGRRQHWLLWLTSLAIAVIIGGLAAWTAWRPPARTAPAMRFSVDLGRDALPGQNVTVSLSRDGTRVAFAVNGPNGKPMLATRRLNQAQATIIPGTENGTDPFFSPDGSSIGFFADGKMKKVSLQGGAPTTLCPAVNPRGADWGTNGRIILMQSAGAVGLSSVDDTSGAVEVLTRPADQGEVTHRWPQILPGGKAVLFTAHTSLGNYEDARIDALDLTTGKWKVVQRGGYFGRYVPGGYLLYLHERTLYGIRFDPGGLSTSGTPVPLLEDIAGNPGTGAGQFAFADNGTLVYRDASSASWPVLWLNRDGTTQQLVPPGTHLCPRFSPDGNLLALNAGLVEIQVYDWRRDLMTRLTSRAAGNSAFPVWTPDGQHLVYRTAAAGRYTVQWISARGGVPRDLFESDVDMRPHSFAPDGRLVLAAITSDAAADLWILPIDFRDPEHPVPGTARPLLQTPRREAEPAVSPDGRWIAYVCDDNGRLEICVARFTEALTASSPRTVVSLDGGRSPLWSSDGQHLYYIALDDRLMDVRYTAKGDVFEREKPTLWSTHQLFSQNASSWNVALAPDGRFAFLGQPNADGDRPSSVHVTVMLNLFDEIARRMPSR